MFDNQRSIYRRSRYNQFGLALWLDCSVPENFTTDVDGNCSQANDRTSFLRHFTQETLANQPKYVLNAINTLPALRFDGVDDFMPFSDPTFSWLEGKSFTIFYVATKTGKQSNSYIFGGQSTAARSNLAVGYLNQTTQRIVFGQDDDNAVVPATTPGVPELYTFRFDSSNNSREIRRNSQRVAFGASDGALNLTDGQALGRYLTSFGQFDLGELIIYDRKMDDYELGVVERDLTSKWAIS